ncbi:hypothetical protein [Saccharopolyspora rosea]|uniref:Lipoprotein n=1 Tax=Saccharopolyspora rosea TaxID=524884 RepID=A0ABW3FZH0_9PSEU|nr:hypothetical protein [Saccharopolyspora rosea]
MPPARLWTAAAGLALTAALGACGTAPPPPPAAGAAAAVPDRRPDATALLTGLVRKLNEQGSVHSTVRGQLGIVGELTGESTVQYRGPQVDLSLTGNTRSGSQPPQHVDLSIVDGVGYLRTPLIRPEPDKPWLRISSDGQDFAAKLLSPALDQLHEAVDPHATFAGVESATRIADRAPDTVDGRPATRYELRIITAQAARTAPDPQQRQRFRKAAESGEPELGYQLWLDDHGLPVKFTAAQRVAQAGDVSLTSTYRDWGTRADISTPPADEIGVFHDLPAQAQPPPR